MTRMTSHSHRAGAVLLLIPLVLSLITFFAYPYAKAAIVNPFGEIATIVSSGAGVAVRDAHGRITYVNPFTITAGTQVASTGVSTVTVSPVTLSDLSYSGAAAVTVNSSTSTATYTLVKNDQATEQGLETTPRPGIALDGNLLLVLEFLGPDGTVVDTLSSQEAIHISFSNISMFGGKPVSSIRVRFTGSVTLTGAYSQMSSAGGVSGTTPIATTYGTVGVGIRINGLTSSSGQYLLSTTTPTAQISQTASYKIPGRGTITVEVLGTSDIGLRGPQTTLSDGTKVNTYGWVRIYNINGPKLSATIWENDPVGADQLKIPVATNIGQAAYFGLTSIPYPNSGSVQANSGNPVITLNAKVPGIYKMDWISIPSDAPHSITNSPVTTTFDTINPTWGFEGRDFPLPTLAYEQFPITLDFSFISPLADDELYIMTKPYSGGEFTTVATIRPGQKGSIAINLQPNGLYDRYVGWKTKDASSSGLMDSTQWTYTTPRSYSEVWSSDKRIALMITAAYAANAVQSITMQSAPVVIQDSAKFIVKIYGPNTTPASGLLVRAYSYDMNLRDRPWNYSSVTNSMGEVELDPGFRTMNRNSTQVKFFVYDPNGTTVIGQGTASLWNLAPVYIVSIPLQTPPADPPAPAATKCTIFGRVTDQNGLGLSGAYVTVIEDNFMQQTDGQGYYRLVDRPVPTVVNMMTGATTYGGSYRVQASLAGCTSQVQSVTVSSGDVKELNFQLTKDPNNPPPITGTVNLDPNQSPTSSSVAQGQSVTTTGTVQASTDQNLTTESAIASLITLLSSAAIVIKIGGAAAF